MFLSKDKPMKACGEKSCDGCDVRGKLVCHFDRGKLLRFIAAAVGITAIGAVGVARYNAWLLLPWLASYVIFFGVIEIRVLCSHCPHYAEDTKSLGCWANYGAPKLWKYRPGPMALWEKIVFIGGVLLIVAFPTVWMILDGWYILLAVYVLAAALGFWALRRFLCTRCINFACPSNAVDEQVRAAFRSKLGAE